MNLKHIFHQNLPLILTSMAVTGTISTVVLAVKATPQAHIDIANAQSEQTEPLSAVDKVRLTWRYYIPTALVGGATLSAILGAHGVNMRRQAALVGLYSLTDRAFSEYKDKMVDVIGPKKEAQAREDLAAAAIERDDVASKEVYIVGNGTHKIYDENSGRLFESDIESVRKAVNDINAQINNEVYASLNDFYRLVGLPPTALGEEVGWRSDRMLDIDFGTALVENEPVISMNYRIAPIRGYWKGHL